jgi:hypothetical protein
MLLYKQKNTTVLLKSTQSRLSPTFFAPLSVREGDIEIFSADYFHPGTAQRAWISSSLCVFTQNVLSECNSLPIVPFTPNSTLQRIECSAFEGSELATMEIPASVEVAQKSCFYYCTSLVSVPFESNSKVQRIEESAFQSSGVHTIQITASFEVVYNF